VIQGLYIFIFS